MKFDQLDKLTMREAAAFLESTAYDINQALDFLEHPEHFEGQYTAWELLGRPDISRGVSTWAEVRLDDFLNEYDKHYPDVDDLWEDLASDVEKAKEDGRFTQTREDLRQSLRQEIDNINARINARINAHINREATDAVNRA